MGLYPVDRLYEEVAFVAYHFNWGHDEVLTMPHHERQRWCEEISKINDRINEQSGTAGEPGPVEGVRSQQTPSGGMSLEQDISDFFEE